MGFFISSGGVPLVTVLFSPNQFMGGVLSSEIEG